MSVAFAFWIKEGGKVFETAKQGLTNEIEQCILLDKSEQRSLLGGGEIDAHR